MKRRTLKSSEAKQLDGDLKRFFPQFVLDTQKGHVVDEVVVDEGKLYFVDGKPFVIEADDRLLPSLVNDELLKVLPSIVVDMGAIPHICNGADIMRPGIRDLQGDFEKGSVVLVKDEKFGKRIAIVVAETTSALVQKMRKGIVAKNIHHVGDQFWEAAKIRH